MIQIQYFQAREATLVCSINIIQGKVRRMFFIFRRAHFAHTGERGELENSVCVCVCGGQGAGGKFQNENIRDKKNELLSLQFYSASPFYLSAQINCFFAKNYDLNTFKNAVSQGSSSQIGPSWFVKSY